MGLVFERERERERETCESIVDEWVKGKLMGREWQFTTVVRGGEFPCFARSSF
jgi:hypothetical protein